MMNGPMNIKKRLNFGLLQLKLILFKNLDSHKGLVLLRLFKFFYVL